MVVAIFPGSFDPITIGHEDIIKRALTVYDKVYVAIGINSDKKSMFSVGHRKEWIQSCFPNESRLSVVGYQGLTVDICKDLKATVIVRGIRDARDLAFESPIAQMNKKMAPNIESVFFLSAPEHSHINSSIIRELIKYNKDVSDFIPKTVTIPRL